jgi:Transglutaminase-like superfamily
MSRENPPMTAKTQTLRLARWLRRPKLVAAVGESVVLLACAEISLRLADLPRVAEWFGATLEFTEAAPGLLVETLDLSPSERRRLAVLNRVALRWPLAPRGACLRHSLSAAYVVRSRGPRLRLSVGKRELGDIAAHAWIEVNGTAVTDPGDFEPLSRRGRSRPSSAPLQEARPDVTPGPTVESGTPQ